MAVASCLILLSPLLPESRRANLVAVLIDRLGSGETYGDRKGAALGLAGVFEELKIGSVQKYGGPPSLHTFSLIQSSILKALDGNQWLTKVESIQLLAAMAFCAPRQLSALLPVVVPQLTHVLASAHQQVRKVARKALEDIGSVVRNPEIQSLVPQLLNALADPSEHTKNALQRLLDTSFVNSVGAPSLALIVPILTRGLRDRTPSTKKMAAQIIGNICSFLRNVKDVLPYTDALVMDLKKALVDPIPDVRSSAARALRLLFRLAYSSFFWIRSATNAPVLSAMALLRAYPRYLPLLAASALSNNCRNYCSQWLTLTLEFVKVSFQFGSIYQRHLVLNFLFPFLEYSLHWLLLLRTKKSLFDPWLFEQQKRLSICTLDVISPLFCVRELLSVLIAAITLNSTWTIHAKQKMNCGKFSCYLYTMVRFAHISVVVEKALGTELRDQVLADLYIVQADSVQHVAQTSWLVCVLS